LSGLTRHDSGQHIQLRADTSTAELRDARLIIAREFGFPTWRELVSFTEKSRRDLDERGEKWRRLRPQAEALLAGDTDRPARLTAEQADTLLQMLAYREAIPGVRLAEELGVPRAGADASPRAGNLSGVAGCRSLRAEQHDMDLPVLDPPGICVVAAIDLAGSRPDCLPLLSLHLAGNGRRALVLVDNLDRRVGPEIVIPAGGAFLPEASPDDGKVAGKGNAQQWRRTGLPGARAGRNNGDNRDPRYQCRQRDLALAQPQEKPVQVRPGLGEQPGTWP
jgi:hypothetical protein